MEVDTSHSSSMFSSDISAMSRGRSSACVRSKSTMPQYRLSCDTDCSEPDSLVQTPTVWDLHFSEKEFGQPPPASALVANGKDEDSLQTQLEQLRTKTAMHERKEMELRSQLVLLQNTHDKRTSALEHMCGRLDSFLINRKEPILETSSDSKTQLDDHVAYTSKLVDQLAAMVAQDRDMKPGLAKLPTDHADVETLDDCGSDRLSLAQVSMGRQLLRHLETLANAHEKKNARLINALQHFQERQHTLNVSLKQSEKHAKHLQREIARMTRESEDYATVMRARLLRAERREKEANERNVSVQSWKEELDISEKALSVSTNEKNTLKLMLDALQSELQLVREELEDTKLQAGRHKAQASRWRAGLDAIQQRGGSNQGIEALRTLKMEAERQAMDLERESKRQALTISELRQERRTLEDKCRSIRNSQDDMNQEQIKAKKQITELQEAQNKSQKAGSNEALDKTVAALTAELKTRIQELKDHQNKAQAAKAEQHEIQTALQKALGERDAQIAKLCREQEKQGTKREAWKKQACIAMETELRTWKDNFQLDITRQVRTLECTIAELEMDIENLERCRQKDARRIEQVESSLAEARQRQRDHWRELKVAEQSQNRVRELEEEVLQLYSKNLKFAHQLGEFVP